VSRRGPRRRRAEGTPLTAPEQPNALWCADYKGEFMLADRRYCYPLTITDFATRFLLQCEALSSTQEIYAFTVFERVFKDFGVPAAIRTDNGDAVRVAECVVRVEQVGRVVAPAGDSDRAHPAGSPRAKWPSRAHAPDAEE
jgi:putative transposase